MRPLRAGYARCSTDGQDLDAQRQALRRLGVSARRTYVDHGLTGTSREPRGCVRPSPRAGPATPWG